MSSQQLRMENSLYSKCPFLLSAASGSAAGIPGAGGQR